MTDLALLKQAAEQATPGPWHFKNLPYDFDDPMIVTADGMYIAQTVYDGQSMTARHKVDEDTAFIAACDPTTILSLLAQLEAQTAALAAAEQRASTAFAEGMERAAVACDSWQSEDASLIAHGLGMIGEDFSVARKVASGLAAAIRQAASEPRHGEE